MLIVLNCVFQYQAGELVIASGFLSRGQAGDERGLIEDDPNEPHEEPIVAPKSTNGKSFTLSRKSPQKFCWNGHPNVN